MYLKASVIALFLAGSTILLTLSPVSNHKKEFTPVQESAVIIELFTSQGCSSCPSADRLLSKLINEAEADGLPVYGLSLHVDYWNRLGWTDPYSDRIHTNRQYAYARKLRSSSVYTPQMIVNGTNQFVGSNSARASSAIKKALAQQQATKITVSDISQKKNQVKVSYELNKVSQGQIINLAVVERGIATEVKRGENSGRLLRHDNVVRAFEQTLSSAKDTATLKLPANLDLDKSSLVIYAQDLDSFEITGATRVALNQLAQ